MGGNTLAAGSLVALSRRAKNDFVQSQCFLGQVLYVLPAATEGLLGMFWAVPKHNPGPLTCPRCSAGHFSSITSVSSSPPPIKAAATSLFYRWEN